MQINPKFPGQAKNGRGSGNFLRPEIRPAPVGPEYFEAAPRDMVMALPGNPEPESGNPTGQVVRVGVVLDAPAPQPSRRLLMDLRAQGSWKASSTSWQPPRETDPGRHPHPALHFASPPQRSRAAWRCRHSDLPQLLRIDR
ncbi:hypothetical protein D9M70_571490 [compost metagenome]